MNSTRLAIASGWLLAAIGFVTLFITDTSRLNLIATTAIERDSIINHAAGEMRTARLELKLADARIHKLEYELTDLWLLSRTNPWSLIPPRRVTRFSFSMLRRR